MWRRLRRRVSRYPSAVVAFVDRDGCPVSFRCRLRADDAARVLLVDGPPVGITLREGPAGLLCHAHDAELWRLRSFIAGGALTRRGERWAFVPETFTRGMGLDPVSMLRMIRGGQRTAAAYLERRGWERPPIDWAALERIKRDVFG